MQGRVQRSISSEPYSKIEGSNNLKINIQQPIVRSNSSQKSSSIHQHNRSQLSIHDKINMLNESIRTSQKNERFFQESMILREKLHVTEQALQDAMIKCSLWDKFKTTIEGLNKEYLQLKSIKNSCSDGTILKEFLSVLKDKLERFSISQRVEKSYSVESKKKDTEYYELYEKEKKQNFEYEQHIITLNNELDMLEENNQKLRQNIKSSSLQSSGVIGSDGVMLSGGQKKIFQENTVLREQNIYLLEHENTLHQQLDAEREKLKEIVESLDHYESEIKKNQLQVKKRNKQLQNEVELAKDAEKTLKIQFQESIEENNNLRMQCQRLTTLLKSIQSQNGQVSNFMNQNQNITQSQEYIQLMSQYQVLYQKYQKVKVQNQVLGEQKQKLGQQMQQIQHLSKQMQYNYQVKIDDLRKHHQGQMQGILNNYNLKILSISAQRSLTIKEVQKEKNTLTQKLQRLHRSTSSQDSDKEQLAMKYQQLNAKYEKAINEYKDQILKCNKEIEQSQVIIEKLKEKVYSLTEEVQKVNHQLESVKLSDNKDIATNVNMIKEIQYRYNSKIQKLQIQGDKLRQINQQLAQQVQNLKQHIETITTQLNQQDQTIEQYKHQLIIKDQLIMKLSNQQLREVKSQQKQQETKANQQNQQNIKQLIDQIERLNKVSQQLRKAFAQNEDNNALLKRNIHDWETKYTSLNYEYELLITQKQSLNNQIEEMITQNQSLKQNINQFAQQITNLQQQIQQLNHKLSSSHTQTTHQGQNTQQTQLDNYQNIQNMDGLMAQALKQQIKTLLEENRTIQEEKNRYRQQISESQQQVQEIQRYVKLISLQNKKIPHYEQQLAKQRMKSQNFKLKLIEQKDKFITIMQKNQSLYQHLVNKNEKNQLILNQNIRIQKEQTQKLQNIINKYYSTFMPSNQ